MRGLLTRVGRLRRHGPALEVAAAGLLAFALSWTYPPGHGLSDLVGHVLGALAGAATVGRRRWPLATLTVVTLAAGVCTVLSISKLTWLAVAWVLVAVVMRCPVRLALSATAGVFAVLGLAVAAAPPTASFVSFGKPWAWAMAALLAGAAAGGYLLRQARAYNAGLREQAERRAQDRADQIRRAVAEERLRIAREMHDIVAHSMSVVAVQAELGGYVARSRPGEAVETLATIATTSRTALQEIRRLVAVLRSDDAIADADRRPPPGLAGLDGLVTSLRSANVCVDLTITGQSRTLPAGLDLAAYRIVQEALTNVVKHADVDRAWVCVEYADRHLAVTVTDHGQGPRPSDHAGHGIIGMRERAALYGGRCTAEPLPAGGFQVRAWLPLEGVGS